MCVRERENHISIQAIRSVAHLQVMIYLIDRVLPESYFDNNLRALSVDMAVFRDLLHLTFPTLSKHLDRLQHAAQDVATGILVL